MSNSVNYTKLLERLLIFGLSPKSTSTIFGFVDFFREAYDDSISKDETNIHVARDIADSLVECLNSTNYKVVSISAKLLRKYTNSTYEIPEKCFDGLIKALNTSSQIAAREVVYSLGCLSCTKPSRSFQPPGIRPNFDRDAPLCFNCHGGYDRGENAAKAVPSLITNLDRPKYKDKSRIIRRASAIALGVIGYQKPEAVLEALDPLRMYLQDEKSVDAVVFALGCIGYTRPDLVEDLIPNFVEAQKRANYPLNSACRYAVMKIGMERGSIIRNTIEGKRKLPDTLDLFFKRMMDYDNPLVSDAIFAIQELAKYYPKEIIEILNTRLEEIHIKRDGSGFLTQNISITLRLLSEDHHHFMKDTVKILLRNFKNGMKKTYRTLDSSARALKNIFEKNPEYIPINALKLLEDFIIEEKRSSVLHNTTELINVIKRQS